MTLGKFHTVTQGRNKKFKGEKNNTVSLTVTNRDNKVQEISEIEILKGLASKMGTAHSKIWV